MKNLIISLIVLISYGCREEQQKEPAASDTVLISDISVIDMSSGDILAHQFIEIENGQISKILSSPPDLESYGEVINGSGKYVLPGLAEMHAHIPSPPISMERLEETLFLYLSNGITTIRGMLGHPSHLELRRLIENGEVLGPRIYTSSPSLNGNSVKTEAEAQTKVRQYKTEGYDFLKIHPGITRPVFDALVETAREVSIPFAGHVPVDVGIRHALESGYASIDHIDGFLEGLVPASRQVDPRENGFFGYNFTALADPGQIPELVALAKENKVWIVPTQSLFERWFAPISSDELLNDPEMVYMPVTTLTNWKMRKEQTMGQGTNFNVEQWKQFDAIRLQLLKSLQDNGHGILLGSDAPQLFNVPGFSIHHEIQGMLRAGLTPLQILQSGTLNPAVYFNKADQIGQIKVGMAADLIILNENPLEDLTALRRLEGVMINGHYLDRKTIDNKLKLIASHAENQ